MRQRFAKTRAGSLTAAAVLAVAGLGSAAQANLVLDLRLAGGGNATTVTPGQSVSLEVVGTVSGGATSAGIQDAFFGVTNSGTIGDLSTVTLTSPFSGVATDVSPSVTTSSSGSLYGVTGSTSVGSTDSTSATGWVFARSTSMTTVTPGTPTVLGTLTFTVSNSALSGGSATLGINKRQAASSLVIPAVWQENGTEKDGGAGYSDQASQGVTITVGSTRLPGDVNGDGFVNSGDINAFIYALSHDATGFSAQYPTGKYTNADVNGTSHVGDGFVNASDINPFIQILSGGGEPGIAAALVAVPEPTSLGLLGLGMMGLVARRRRA